MFATLPRELRCCIIFLVQHDECLQDWHHQIISTPPKNNIAPENRPGKGDPHWKPPFLAANC